MLIAASVLAGAATTVYALSKSKSVACFVVAMAMTLHFYHPVMGRPLFQTFLIYGVTTLCAFIAAYLGHFWASVFSKKEPAGSLVPAGQMRCTGLSDNINFSPSAGQSGKASKKAG
jgi:hypothetical protein